jgi:hypothetical protein
MEVAPRSFMLSIQDVRLRLEGAKEFTSEELQPPFGSQPSQFSLSQPGSPSWKKLAMPKCASAEMPPWYASWAGVGVGKFSGLGTRMRGWEAGVDVGGRETRASPEIEVGDATTPEAGRAFGSAVARAAAATAALTM